MIADKAVKLAVKLGASEAEAYQVEGRNLQVQFTPDDKNIKTVISSGIGVRVAIGKRLGMYSTSIIDESELKATVEKAVKIAKVAPEDPDWSFFNQKFGSVPVSGLYDKSIIELDPVKIVDFVNSANDVIKSYNTKVNPAGGILGVSYSKIVLANSSHDELVKQGTSIFGYMSASADDKGKHCNGSEFEACNFLSDYDFNDVAKKAASMAINFLESKQVEGGNMPVIIRNKVFGSILGVMLSNAINADVVQKGASPLIDKIGEKVAADYIQIYDHGCLNGGLNSQPFDDEGHSTQKTPIIDEGILKNYIYDNYTAQKNQTESTGNGIRGGYKTPISPSVSNLVLEKTSTSVDKLIENTKHGLYIHSVIGEWLSNTVSGELNATVTHGYIIENGELAQPVKGLVIAGNFYDILKTKMNGIASDTTCNGGVYSPSVKIDELSVAGK